MSSELLRKRAEHTLHDMVHTVFLNGINYAAMPVSNTAESTSISAEALVSEVLSPPLKDGELDTKDAEEKNGGGGSNFVRIGGEKDKPEPRSEGKEEKGEHINSRGIRFQNQETG